MWGVCSCMFTVARYSQTAAGDARPAAGEDAAPQGWWPGLIEVAEEPFHGLGGPCPCVCFTQVPCKTPESLGAHTVASRGSLSFKRNLSPLRNGWEMSRRDPDISSSQKAGALTCPSPLTRARARGDSREHSAVAGVCSGPAVLGQHTAAWLPGGC